jgi:hypothetical protein
VPRPLSSLNPVLALAFAANALLKEFRRAERRRPEIVLAFVGLALGLVPVAMVLFRLYS